MIVDRLTETRAYLEDDGGDILSVPRERLPAGVREGDVLIADGEGYRIDEKAAEARREMLKDRLARLMKKS